MNKTFDPDWPHGHVTRDGHKARIICKDRAGAALPIIALVKKGNREEVLYYRDNGLNYTGREEPCDLFNYQPIQLKVGDVVEDSAGNRGFVYSKTLKGTGFNIVFESLDNKRLDFGKFFSGGEPMESIYSKPITKILKVKE